MAFNSSIPVKAAETKSGEITRRRAGYAPTSWTSEFILSLPTDFHDETHKKIHQNLIGMARIIFDEIHEHVDLVYFVDTVQKLGIAYHFQESMNKALHTLFGQRRNMFDKGTLDLVSTLFRLLRDNGYQVSQDVFRKFLDQKNYFDPLKCGDAQGLLSLYEASFLSYEGENLLDEAREFSKKHLKELQESIGIATLKEKIIHSLELPIYRRVLRFEHLWFIKIYACEINKCPILLKLAQLDYNLVQSMYRDELKEISRWWEKLKFSENFNYSRDRIVECFTWSIGLIYEPQFSYCRKRITQIIAFIALIDDAYDLYGTMEEVTLFTECVERWNFHGSQQLPKSMKALLLALFDYSNKLAYDILNKKNIDINLQLKTLVSSFCKSYYIEAKWYHNKYIPSFDEYIENGVISGVAPVILGILCLIVCEDVELASKVLQIVRQTSIIARVIDDIGTSKKELKRGDVHKALECYMHQEGATEAKALEYLRDMIDGLWKKMNYERFSNKNIPQLLANGAINYSRMAHFTYLYGDAFGAPCKIAKEYVKTLLFEYLPIDG